MAAPAAWKVGLEMRGVGGRTGHRRHHLPGVGVHLGHRGAVIRLRRVAQGGKLGHLLVREVQRVPAREQMSRAEHHAAHHGAHHLPHLLHHRAHRPAWDHLAHRHGWPLGRVGLLRGKRRSHRYRQQQPSQVHGVQPAFTDG